MIVNVFVFIGYYGCYGHFAPNAYRYTLCGDILDRFEPSRFVSLGNSGSLPTGIILFVYFFILGFV
jgi:hypothetical protein